MAQVESFFLPDELYYDKKDHLWARLEGEEKVRVGLDAFGQKAAGTVAYLKLLPQGKTVKKGKPFGSLEAGKYVGPLRAPVEGAILSTNEKVLQNPGLVNSDPYGDGWFVIIKASYLQEDLKDLAHGPQEIHAWLEKELKEYREKGLLPEDEA